MFGGALRTENAQLRQQLQHLSEEILTLNRKLSTAYRRADDAEQRAGGGAVSGERSGESPDDSTKSSADDGIVHPPYSELYAHIAELERECSRLRADLHAKRQATADATKIHHRPKVEILDETATSSRESSAALPASVSLLSVPSVMTYGIDSPTFTSVSRHAASHMSNIGSFFEELIAAASKFEAKGREFARAGDHMAHTLRTACHQPWAASVPGIGSGLSTMGHVMQELQSYLDVTLLSLRSAFLEPLEEFLSTETASARKAQEAMESAEEERKSALGRFLNVKKKPAGQGDDTVAAREEDAAAATRRYETARFDAARQLHQWDLQARVTLSARLCALFYTLRAFHTQCSSTMRDQEPAVRSLQLASQEALEEATKRAEIWRRVGSQLHSRLSRLFVTHAQARAGVTPQAYMAGEDHGEARRDNGGQDAGQDPDRSGSATREGESGGSGGRAASNSSSSGPPMSTLDRIEEVVEGTVREIQAQVLDPERRIAADLQEQQSGGGEARGAASARDAHLSPTLHRLARQTAGGGGGGGRADNGAKQSSARSRSGGRHATERERSQSSLPAAAASGGSLPVDAGRGNDGGGIVIAGWLFKKSSGSMSGVRRGWEWQRRWFFVRNGKLWYIRGPDDLAPELVAELVVSNIRPAGPESNVADSRHAFEIRTPGKRIYYLQASTLALCHKWVTTLRRCAEEELLVHGGSGTASAPAGGNSGGTSGAVAAPDAVRDRLQAVQVANPRCADCGQPSPDWACINHGILVCIACSGVHRSLGTHRSKVRSIALDAWDASTVAILESIGNDAFNGTWEAVMPAGWRRPPPDASTAEREKFIRAKYEWKGFVPNELHHQDADTHGHGGALSSAEIAARESQEGDRQSRKFLDAVAEGDLVAAGRCLALGAVPTWRLPEPVSLPVPSSHPGDEGGQRTVSLGRGSSSVHAAAVSGRSAVVGFVWLNGGRLDDTDAEEKSPKDIAAELGHSDVTAFIDYRLTEGMR